MRLRLGLARAFYAIQWWMNLHPNQAKGGGVTRGKDLEDKYKKLQHTI